DFAGERQTLSRAFMNSLEPPPAAPNVPARNREESEGANETEPSGKDCGARAGRAARIERVRKQQRFAAGTGAARSQRPAISPRRLSTPLGRHRSKRPGQLHAGQEGSRKSFGESRRTRQSLQLRFRGSRPLER